MYNRFLFLLPLFLSRLPSDNKKLTGNKNRPILHGPAANRELCFRKRLHLWLNECGWAQWRSEAECHPEADHKNAAFSPYFAPNNLKWAKIIFRPYQSIKNNKACWTSESNTLKLKWVLFFLPTTDLAFSACSTPFFSLLFQFFLTSLLFTHSMGSNKNVKH